MSQQEAVGYVLVVGGIVVAGAVIGGWGLGAFLGALITFVVGMTLLTRSQP